MSETTADEQLSLPPQTFAEVLERYPDMDENLRQLTADLAAKETGADPPVTVSDEAVQAAAEAATDNQEITPEHHERHLTLARAVDPEVDQRPAAEQDLIGELLEIGDTATKDAASVVPETKQLSWADRLDKLQQPDTADPPQVVAAITDIRKLYSTDESGYQELNPLETALADRPEAVRALMATANQDSTGWNQLAMGVAIKKAAEVRAERSGRELYFTSDPFSDTPATVDPDAAAADAAAAEVLLQLGGPFVPRDPHTSTKLLRKYSSLESDGVTLAKAQDYESITYRDYSDEKPAAADVLTVTAAYEQASPQWRERFSSATRYDPRRLSSIGKLAAELEQVVPPEQLDRAFWNLASVTGCERSTQPETSAFGSQLVSHLTEQGADLRGLVAMLDNAENLVILQTAAAGDAEQYQKTLGLIGQLSHYPPVFEQLSANEETLDVTNGVSLKGILKDLAQQPDTYSPSVEAITTWLPQALEAGYDPTKVKDVALEAFSMYAGNLVGYYGRPDDENLGTIYARYTAFQLQAMTMLGDSSRNMADLFEAFHDPYVGGVTDMLLADKSVDAPALQRGLRELEAAVMPFADMPDNHELFLRLIPVFGGRGKVEAIGEVITLAELVQQPGQPLADRLLQTEHPWLVADHLPLFSNLDNETAHRLLAGDTAGRVLEHPGAFPELQIDRGVFDNLIADGRLAVVLEHAEAFNGVDPLEAAEAAIAGGLAVSVFSRLGEFPGIATMETDNERVRRFQSFINDPELGLLIGADGPLYNLAPQFMQLYMASENPVAVATQIKALAGSADMALWRINHEYAKLLVGEVGNVGYMAGYKVDAIPLALPGANVSNDDLAPQPIALADMDSEYRTMIMTPEALTRYGDSLSSLTELNFKDLLPEYQDALLGYRLYEAIGTSRDHDEQRAASERNKRFAAQENYWQAGDLVHATKEVADFRRILMSGLLCGETLGLDSAHDSYPFNVDTVEVSDRVLQQDTHGDRLRALANQSYGPIALLFHRDSDSTDYQREFPGGMNNDHRLVFGALPSTEISAVLLRADSEELQAAVVDAVIDAGTYMPVVNGQGITVLSYEQYQQRRAEGNYVNVQPRVVDSSFKREGTQGGSNEGAMFVIPGATGLEHYYVKFGDTSAQQRDHLWNEILADKLYGTVTPDLVPATEAVVVEGRLARSSKLVTLAETRVTDEARNAGFVMDAFLGNWDAVFNDDNLVMSADDYAMRIDNGNAMNFRARGERKEDGQFGPTVTEIETGIGSLRLGGGMRQMYPGITDEQITVQVRELAERLPDAMIDALVDSVRLPASERLQLKQVLKARRNDLVQRYPSSR